MNSGSLRIVHVANFGFKATKVYLHNVSAKLSNGWTRLGHHVLNFSDRDLSRWLSPLGLRRLGDAKVNALLIDYCTSNQPDVLVLGHAEVITNETIDRIRRALPGIRVVYWNFDWILPLSHPMGATPEADLNRRKIRGRLEAVDAAFVTTAGQALEEIAEGRGQLGFMPNPVDPSVERGRNFEISDPGLDLFFSSGSSDPTRHHAGKARDMNDLADLISEGLPGLTMSTPGLKGSPTLYGPAYEQAILGCRSGLNISRYNDVSLYSSDRIAHIAGNGLAVILDRATGYDALFGDEGMVFYDSEDSLMEGLERLSGDDAFRRRVAMTGWRRYFDLFESSKVGQYMLDVAMERRAPARDGWPVGPVAATDRYATSAFSTSAS